MESDTKLYSTRREIKLLLMELIRQEDWVHDADQDELAKQEEPELYDKEVIESLVGEGDILEYAMYLIVSLLQEYASGELMRFATQTNKVWYDVDR